jgi:hypothetical protein
LVPIVVVLAALAVAIPATRQHGPAQRTVDDDLALLSKFPMATLPPTTRVCSDPMTTACAQETATKAGRPIAWIELPPGFSPDGEHLIPIRGGGSVFIEELHSTRSLVGLHVGDGRSAVGARDGIVEVDGAPVTILHHYDLGAALGATYDYYATWIVDGRIANLSVHSSKEYGGTAQSTRADLYTLLKHVQVAVPG